MLTYRQATIDEIYELRFAVLRSGQRPVKLYFQGDDDGVPRTWHFGAFRAKGNGAGVENVGCLTIFASMFEEKAAMQLRGMAVADGVRGTGVGSGLLVEAERVVRRDLRGAGLDERMRWWCNARSPAIRFYERNGWRVVSQEFVIEHYGPHRRMVKEFA